MIELLMWWFVGVFGVPALLTGIFEKNTVERFLLVSAGVIVGLFFILTTLLFSGAFRSAVFLAAIAFPIGTAFYGLCSIPKNLRVKQAVSRMKFENALAGTKSVRVQ